MKIGQKLILVFLLVSILVGLVGFISINISQRALQKYIGESSISLAVETLDKIDRHIYGRIEGFQAYCKDAVLQQSILASNQEFEKLDDIEAYITRQDKEWTSVPKEILTPFMQQLINNRLSLALKEKLGFYKKSMVMRFMARYLRQINMALMSFKQTRLLTTDKMTKNGGRRQRKTVYI